MNLDFKTFKIEGDNYLESHKENNVVSVVLVAEEGYEDFFRVNNYLTEKCNLKLISNEGITDMSNLYKYDNENLTLRYLSEIDGMLILEYTPKNQQQLINYRFLVHHINKDVLEENRIEKEK